MAKLISHVIDGQIIGVDLLSWSLIKVPFKIINDADDIPLGYTNISSIQTWWDYGQHLSRDYLYVRNEIKKLVAKIAVENNDIIDVADAPNEPINEGDSYVIDTNNSAIPSWANHAGFIATYKNSAWVVEPSENVGYRLLNNIEQLICAELKIGGQQDHFLDYGVPTIVDYGVEFHRQSIEVRKERMLRATVEIYNRLPKNATQVLKDLSNGPLGDTISRYEKYGVKGTYEDFNIDFNPEPTPGVLDYIMARAPFINTEPYIGMGFVSGMKLKNWNPIDAADLDSFANEIYTILNEGYIKYQ